MHTVRNSLVSWLFVALRTIVYKDFVLKKEVRNSKDIKPKSQVTLRQSDGAGRKVLVRAGIPYIWEYIYIRFLSELLLFY